MPPQRCSKCGRNRAGHTGPLGKKCTMKSVRTRQKSPDSDEEWEPCNEIDELAKHIGKLAISVKQLADGQSMLRSELQELKEHTKPSTPVSSPIPAAPSSNTQHTPLADISAPDNLTAIAESFTSLPTGARVSAKTLRATKCGEFVNLSDYIPCNEPSLSYEAAIVDDKMSFRKKRTHRNMDNFFIWSLAWAGYEGVILNEHPSLYKQLMTYKLFIQECDIKFHWHAVYTYDAKLRHKCSLTRSFDFHVIETGFYVHLLEHLKPSKAGCFRCGSLFHFRQDCPFQETNEMATNKASARSTNFSQARSGRNNSRRTVWNVDAQPFTPGNRHSNTQGEVQPICINWNSDKCFNGANCPRRHVCSKCNGRDPISRCARCSTPNINLQK